MVSIAVSFRKRSSGSFVNRDGYISNSWARLDAIKDRVELTLDFSDYGIPDDDTGLIAPDP